MDEPFHEWQRSKTICILPLEWNDAGGEFWVRRGPYMYSYYKETSFLSLSRVDPNGNQILITSGKVDDFDDAQEKAWNHLTNLGDSLSGIN